jgi:hypothetical protein
MSVLNVGPGGQDLREGHDANSSHQLHPLPDSKLLLATNADGTILRPTVWHLEALCGHERPLEQRKEREVLRTS